ncbi:unnamed protein product, partial [Allacma fusca]
QHALLFITYLPCSYKVFPHVRISSCGHYEEICSANIDGKKK